MSIKGVSLADGVKRSADSCCGFGGGIAGAACCGSGSGSVASTTGSMACEKDGSRLSTITADVRLRRPRLCEAAHSLQCSCTQSCEGGKTSRPCCKPQRKPGTLASPVSMPSATGASHDRTRNAHLHWSFLRSPGAGRLLVILQHPVDRLEGLQPLGQRVLIAVLIIPDGASQLCLRRSSDGGSDMKGSTCRPA